MIRNNKDSLIFEEEKMMFSLNSHVVRRTLISAAAFVTFAAPGLALADNPLQDVVRDKRGAIVHDTDGDCVYTKWPVASDECGDAVPESYLVFFDFDKATLTPEAKSVIKAAANAIKSSNADRVEVIGHADRSGSKNYNMALSKRRAAAVKTMLVKLGVKKNSIAAMGRGESDPLVPTADGVREPQNRRVEILF